MKSVEQVPELLKTLWRGFDFSPDDEQAAAILYSDGPLFLPAGPGSGKSRVLLWRTVSLITTHGVRSGKIFLSTFTEKALLQLRNGLRTLLSAVSAKTGQPYDTARLRQHRPLALPAIAPRPQNLCAPPAEVIERHPRQALSAQWTQEPPLAETQAVGDVWARENRSAVLAVPSVLIPEEFNYLLNPALLTSKKSPSASPSHLPLIHGCSLEYRERQTPRWLQFPTFDTSSGRSGLVL